MTIRNLSKLVEENEEKLMNL
jgi:hypothetical protein